MYIIDPTLETYTIEHRDRFWPHLKKKKKSDIF